MPAGAKSNLSATHTASSRGLDGSPFVKWTLIFIGLAFALLFLLLPLVDVFYEALAGGRPFLFQVTRASRFPVGHSADLDNCRHRRSLNLVFGLAAAWAIAKFDFRGKSILITLIDSALRRVAGCFRPRFLSCCSGCRATLAHGRCA